MSDELANKVFGIVVNKFYVEGDPSCEFIYAFCPPTARRVAANAPAIWRGFVHANSSLSPRPREYRPRWPYGWDSIEWLSEPSAVRDVSTRVGWRTGRTGALNLRVTLMFRSMCAVRKDAIRNVDFRKMIDDLATVDHRLLRCLP